MIAGSFAPSIEEFFIARPASETIGFTGWEERYARGSDF
jgi:hypothetical protein